MHNSPYVDLHLHTTASDGVHGGEELVEFAGRAGLSAIAITDHDSVESLPVTRRAAERAGIRLVPGVELSAAVDGASVHMLGYFVEIDADGFRARLETLRSERQERARRMVERLDGLGVHIRLERVLEIAGDAAVGRPHISEAMLEAGYVETFQQSFERYIGMHAPAYVRRELVTPREAIDLIRSVGGVAVLAHPGTLGRDVWIPQFVREGMQGLEVWHPRHGPERARRYQAMAEELGLVATGGSDFHGGLRGESTVGEQPVQARVVDELAALARES